MVSLGTLEIGLKLDRSEFDAALQSLKTDMSGFARSVPPVKLSIEANDAGLNILKNSLDGFRNHAQQVQNQIKPIVIRVDDRALTDLNKHLDSKKSHVQQIQQFFNASPLTPRIDDSKLTQLNSKLDQLESRYKSLGKQLTGQRYDIDIREVHTVKYVEGKQQKQLTGSSNSSNESSQPTRIDPVQTRAINRQVQQALAMDYTIPVQQSVPAREEKIINQTKYLPSIHTPTSTTQGGINLPNGLQGFVNDLSKFAKSILNVSSALDTLFNRTKTINVNPISKTTSSNTSIGQDLIQGLITGATSSEDKLKSTFLEIGKLPEKTIRQVTETQSPSKVFYRIGVDWMTGLHNGVQDGFQNIVNLLSTFSELENNIKPIHLEVDTSQVNKLVETIDLIKLFNNQKIKLLEIPQTKNQIVPFTVNVNDKDLTELNEKLDLEKGHFDRINSRFNSQPLTPITDSSGLRNLDKELDTVEAKYKGIQRQLASGIQSQITVDGIYKTKQENITQALINPINEHSVSTVPQTNQSALIGQIEQVSSFIINGIKSSLSGLTNNVLPQLLSGLAASRQRGILPNHSNVIPVAQQKTNVNKNKPTLPKLDINDEDSIIEHYSAVHRQNQEKAVKRQEAREALRAQSIELGQAYTANPTKANKAKFNESYALEKQLRPPQVPQAYQEIFDQINYKGHYDSSNIPHLLSTTPSKESIQGGYDQKINTIAIRPEINAGLQSNNLTPEQRIIVTHELLHGTSRGLGNIEGSIQQDQKHIIREQEHSFTQQELNRPMPFVASNPTLLEFSKKYNPDGKSPEKEASELYAQGNAVRFTTQHELRQKIGIGGTNLDQLPELATANYLERNLKNALSFNNEHNLGKNTQISALQERVSASLQAFITNKSLLQQATIQGNEHLAPDAYAFIEDINKEIKAVLAEAKQLSSEFHAIHNASPSSIISSEPAIKPNQAAHITSVSNTILHETQKVGEEIGKNLNNAIATGQEKSLPNAINATKESTEDITEASRKGFGIESPSKVFELIGKLCNQGWIKGFLNFDNSEILNFLKKTTKGTERLPQEIAPVIAHNPLHQIGPSAHNNELHDFDGFFDNDDSGFAGEDDLFTDGKKTRKLRNKPKQHQGIKLNGRNFTAPLEPESNIFDDSFGTIDEDVIHKPYTSEELQHYSSEYLNIAKFARNGKLPLKGSDGTGIPQLKLSENLLNENSSEKASYYPFINEIKVRDSLFNKLNDNKSLEPDETTTIFHELAHGEQYGYGSELGINALRNKDTLPSEYLHKVPPDILNQPSALRKGSTLNDFIQSYDAPEHPSELEAEYNARINASQYLLQKSIGTTGENITNSPQGIFLQNLKNQKQKSVDTRLALKTDIPIQVPIIQRVDKNLSFAEQSLNSPLLQQGTRDKTFAIDAYNQLDAINKSLETASKDLEFINKLLEKVQSFENANNSLKNLKSINNQIPDKYKSSITQEAIKHFELSLTRFGSHLIDLTKTETTNSSSTLSYLNFDNINNGIDEFSKSTNKDLIQLQKQGKVPQLPPQTIDVIPLAREVGANVPRGLTKGMVETEQEPIEEVGGISQKLIDKSKEILKEQSPSEEFAKIGQDAMKGETQGLVTGSKELLDTAKGIGEKVIEASRVKPTSGYPVFDEILAFANGGKLPQQENIPKIISNSNALAATANPDKPFPKTNYNPHTNTLNVWEGLFNGIQKNNLSTTHKNQLSKVASEIVSAGFGDEKLKPRVITPEGYKPLMTEQEAIKYTKGSVFQQTFYHGTKQDYADSILKNGVDIEANTKGQYGKGFYLAEDFNIAKNYANDYTQPSVISTKIYSKNPKQFEDLSAFSDYRNTYNLSQNHEIPEHLISQGYDSLHIKKSGYLVAFDGKQVAGFGQHNFNKITPIENVQPTSIEPIIKPSTQIPVINNPIIPEQKLLDDNYYGKHGISVDLEQNKFIPEQISKLRELPIGVGVQKQLDLFEYGSNSYINKANQYKTFAVSNTHQDELAKAFNVVSNFFENLRIQFEKLSSTLKASNYVPNDEFIATGSGSKVKNKPVQMSKFLRDLDKEQQTIDVQPITQAIKPHSLVPVGKDIVGGLGEGMLAEAGELKAISAEIGIIPEKTIRTVTETHSASRKLKNVGADIMLGLREGLQGGIGEILQVIGTIRIAELLTQPFVFAIQNLAFGLQSFVSESYKFAQEVEKIKLQLEDLTGSASKADTTFGDFVKQSQKYGGNAKDLSNAHIVLAQSSIGTPLEYQSKDIITKLNQAFAAKAVSNEDRNKAFEYINEIASRGEIPPEVIAKELPRIVPGALGIAARSQGLSQQQFLTQAKAGGINSEKFISQFANQAQQESINNLGSALDSPTTKLSQFQARISTLQESLGQVMLSTIGALVGPLNTFFDLLVKGQDAIKALALVIGVQLVASTIQASGAFTNLSIAWDSFMAQSSNLATGQLENGFTRLGAAIGSVTLSIASLAAGFAIAFAAVEIFKFGKQFFFDQDEEIKKNLEDTKKLANEINKLPISSRKFDLDTYRPHITGDYNKDIGIAQKTVYSQNDKSHGYDTSNPFTPLDIDSLKSVFFGEAKIPAQIAEDERNYNNIKEFASESQRVINSKSVQRYNDPIYLANAQKQIGNLRDKESQLEARRAYELNNGQGDKATVTAKELAKVREQEQTTIQTQFPEINQLQTLQKNLTSTKDWINKTDIGTDQLPIIEKELRAVNELVKASQSIISDTSGAWLSLTESIRKASNALANIDFTKQRQLSAIQINTINSQLSGSTGSQGAQLTQLEAQRSVLQNSYLSSGKVINEQLNLLTQQLNSKSGNGNVSNLDELSSQYRFGKYLKPGQNFLQGVTSGQISPTTIQNELDIDKNNGAPIYIGQKKAILELAKSISEAQTNQITSYEAIKQNELQTLQLQIAISQAAKLRLNSLVESLAEFQIAQADIAKSRATVLLNRQQASGTIGTIAVQQQTAQINVNESTAKLTALNGELQGLSNNLTKFSSKDLDTLKEFLGLSPNTDLVKFAKSTSSADLSKRFENLSPAQLGKIESSPTLGAAKSTLENITSISQQTRQQEVTQSETLKAKQELIISAQDTLTSLFRNIRGVKESFDDFGRSLNKSMLDAQNALKEAKDQLSANQLKVSLQGLLTPGHSGFFKELSSIVNDYISQIDQIKAQGNRTESDKLSITDQTIALTRQVRSLEEQRYDIYREMTEKLRGASALGGVQLTTWQNITETIGKSALEADKIFEIFKGVVAKFKGGTSEKSEPKSISTLPSNTNSPSLLPVPPVQPFTNNNQGYQPIVIPLNSSKNTPNQTQIFQQAKTLTTKNVSSESIWQPIWNVPIETKKATGLTTQQKHIEVAPKSTISHPHTTSTNYQKSVESLIERQHKKIDDINNPLSILIRGQLEKDLVKINQSLITIFAKDKAKSSNKIQFSNDYDYENLDILYNHPDKKVPTFKEWKKQQEHSSLTTGLLTAGFNLNGLGGSLVAQNKVLNQGKATDNEIRAFIDAIFFAEVRGYKNKENLKIGPSHLPKYKLNSNYDWPSDLNRADNFSGLQINENDVNRFHLKQKYKNINPENQYKIGKDIISTFPNASERIHQFFQTKTNEDLQSAFNSIKGFWPSLPGGSQNGSGQNIEATLSKLRSVILESYNTTQSPTITQALPVPTKAAITPQIKPTTQLPPLPVISTSQPEFIYRAPKQNDPDNEYQAPIDGDTSGFNELNAKYGNGGTTKKIPRTTITPRIEPTTAQLTPSVLPTTEPNTIQVVTDTTNVAPAASTITTDTTHVTANNTSPVAQNFIAPTIPESEYKQKIQAVQNTQLQTKNIEQQSQVSQIMSAQQNAINALENQRLDINQKILETQRQYFQANSQANNEYQNAINKAQGYLTVQQEIKQAAAQTTQEYKAQKEALEDQITQLDRERDIQSSLITDYKTQLKKAIDKGLPTDKLQADLDAGKSRVEQINKLIGIKDQNGDLTGGVLQQRRQILIDVQPFATQSTINQTALDKITSLQQAYNKVQSDFAQAKIANGEDPFGGISQSAAIAQAKIENLIRSEETEQLIRKSGIDTNSAQAQSLRGMTDQTNTLRLQQAQLTGNPIESNFAKGLEQFFNGSTTGLGHGGGNRLLQLASDSIKTMFSGLTEQVSKSVSTWITRTIWGDQGAGGDANAARGGVNPQAILNAPVGTTINQLTGMGGGSTPELSNLNQSGNIAFFVGQPTTLSSLFSSAGYNPFKNAITSSSLSQYNTQPMQSLTTFSNPNSVVSNNHITEGINLITGNTTSKPSDTGSNVNSNLLTSSMTSLNQQVILLTQSFANLNSQLTLSSTTTSTTSLPSPNSIDSSMFLGGQNLNFGLGSNSSLSSNQYPFISGANSSNLGGFSGISNIGSSIFSNIFGGASNAFSSAGDAATAVSSSGMFDWISSIFGFNEGGLVANYADGGNVSLSDLGSQAIIALNKEKAASGKTPVLAALTPGEYVVPIHEVPSYMAAKKAGVIGNYADGGIVTSQPYLQDVKIQNYQNSNIGQTTTPNNYSSHTNNNSNTSQVVNNNWNINYTPNSQDSLSDSQIRARNQAQMQRSVNRFGK